MLKLTSVVLISLFLSSLAQEASADIIYLRNGRNIEGLITKENDEEVELNIGIGKMKFRRIEIESIHKSNPNETALIRKRWINQSQEEEERRLKRELELEEKRRKDELKPKEIEVSRTGEHIIVNALLNGKLEASLLLDTGASLVLISSQIAQTLGIKISDPSKVKIMTKMADGRDVEASYIVLESINVQGAEAKNIPAAVLSGDALLPEDGLLGMSFLKNFNFQIDSANKKLILQKAE
jgi:clan AA aspartic protease (TIGR02281 family)